MKKIFIIASLFIVLAWTQLYAENKIHDFKTGKMHSADSIYMQATDEINVANVYDALVWLKDNSLGVDTLENYVLSTTLATTLLDYVTNTSLATTLNGYVSADTLDNYVLNTSLSSTLLNYVTSASLSITLADYVLSSSLATTFQDYATNATLENYVLTSVLSTTLLDYVTNISLSISLSGYVTTVALGEMLSGYATNETLENYLQASDLINYALKTDVSSEVIIHNESTTSVHGIANTADLATKAETSQEVLVHNDDTTIVHGIADTTQLATKAMTSEEVLVHNEDVNAHTLAGFLKSAIIKIYANSDPTCATGSSITLKQGSNVTIVRTGDTFEISATASSSGGGSYSAWTDLGMSVTRNDDDTFTVDDDATSQVYLKKGYPIKFVVSGTTYYAILNTLTDNGATLTFDICGAPMTGTPTAMYAGTVEKVRQLNFAINGYFGDAAETTLLANDMFLYYRWDLPLAYLCKTSIRTKTLDSGAGQERINITLGTADVLTANTNAGLECSTAWVNNTIDINTSNYDVNFGDTVEIKTDGNGTNGDARDLSIQLNFVME